MAKRHIKEAGDWESIICRLEELVLANSGEDEFDEIFKLLIAKMYSELDSTDNEIFKAQNTFGNTTFVVNNLLTKAHHKWKGMFLTVPRSNLTDEHLQICVKELENLNLLASNLEVVDAFFEYLVNKSSKGTKGQFFTPRYIIDCCVKAINPAKHDLIVDPACGSGGFLIHALDHYKEKYAEYSIDEYAKDHLWGFDFDYKAVQVAKALMLIAGDGSSNLYRLNSLVGHKLNRKLMFDSTDVDGSFITIEDVMKSNFKSYKGFDIVITNPPFAGEIKEQDILNSFDLSKVNRRTERDVLFIERCIQLLKPGGRIAIVLPTNKLSGAAWDYMREWLIKRLQIVSVVGLHRNTFLPHTHQKTAILFGVKREKILTSVKVDEDIFFYVSDSAGKDTRGKYKLKNDVSHDVPAWDKVDHDLNDFLTQFNEFILQNNIPWGS